MRSLATLSLWPLLLILLTITAASGGKRPKIIVGGDHDNPPYEFLENGKPTGFNIELIRAVSEVMGFDVEFRLGPWSKVRQKLEQGKIDALAGMYYSPQRSQLLDFSVSHTVVTSGIFVRKGSPIHSFEDIRGKEVIVQEGDVIHDYLREHNLTPHIIAVTNPADELRLLASGRHDCAIMPSRLQGEYLVKKLNLTNIGFIRSDLPQLSYCFAVRKGNGELLHRLDEGLNILKITGRYREINEKWFGVYEKRNLWETIKYYVLALALSLALFLGFLIWSGMLKRRVEQRTAELRRSEEELRFTQYAIDKTIDQAFWMTKDGRLFYVNDAACRTLGYTCEELTRMSVPDYCPSAPPEVFAEHWRDLQENGHVRLETLHRAKDGRVYPVEVRANYVVFDGKEYNCAFATDISERKRAEEELRENEEKFRVLAETSPAAICVYQGENIIYCNAAMMRLTGYTERELKEMRFWEWMHEDCRESVRERGLARQRGEPVPSQYENKYLTKNGEEKWLFLSAGRIEYKGKPAGIVTMFDITDRKRMEEELLQAHDELEKRVDERTLALRNANELLQHEIYERKRTESINMARLRLLQFAATHTLDELLEATLDEAEALTGSLIGFYHFLEADQETLSLQNWSTRTKKEFCTAEGKGLHYDVSAAGIWVDCIQERRPVIHNDYASIPYRKGLPPGHAPLIRELVVPVFRGGSIVAIIGVGNKPHDYTSEDIEAVSFLADLAWEIAERKKAEEALRLSQFCIDKAGIGIYQSDETGVIFSVNEHACKSLGYSREELCALSVFDIDPEITREKMLTLKKILDETGTMTHETTHRRRDGTTFPVEITANFLDFHGKRYGISFVKDITERKEAEESVKRAKEEWERTFASVPDLIAILDNRHRVLRVNEAMAKRLGLKPDECVGLHCYEAIHWLSESPPFCPHTQTLMDGRKHVVEVHEERLGGDFLVSTIPLNDERGVMIGSVHIAYDITERKRAEEALRESESRVRRKLESILDPEGDTGELDLADILDAPGIQALMDDLYSNTGLKMSIIDLKGRVLVDVGWQDICLKFHRSHPETLKKCLESDTELTVGVPQGEFKTYRCRNNMWHLVTPIIVGGRHMGNLFMGQFFYENEELDYDLFRAQARQYGFPEEEYIAALEAVPRYSEDCVKKGKTFFLRLIDMFSKLSYANIKLAHSLAELDRLTATVRQANMVVENSPVVLFRCKAAPGWPVELVSRNVVQFGYTPEEFLSGEITYSSIVYPQDLGRLITETEEYAATGEGQLLQEYRIVTKGGDIRWIIDETICERNEEGEITHYEGVMIDVTERKRAEDSIRESKAKYQVIVDSFDGLIYVASQDYRIMFMNRKLIERTGRDAVGEYCYKVMNDMDSVCPWCVNDRVFAGETVHREMFSPKDNRWYHAVNVPIRHANGSMSKHSMIIDITDRKMFEEELQRQKQLLEELNRTLEVRVREEVAKNREKDIILIQQNRLAALGEMFDHIAHQWKQPLNSIAVIIQALGSISTHEQVTTKDILETVDSIMDMVGHMAQTVEVFRNFYKPDKEKSVFLIKDSIDKALTFVTPVFRRYGIGVNLGADPELSAFGYPKEYAQVLLNILANAKDALREREVEKPRIDITAFADGDNMVVTIADNAGGIPDESIGRIFDLYFTTKESSGGTGIGLYMSKNIIEKNMGGKLTVSNTDNGAQFKIELGKS